MSEPSAVDDPSPPHPLGLATPGIAVIEVSSADASYGGRALRGFGWLAARTVAGKGISLAGQILLARLLVPDEFGRIVLAVNVCTFANILLVAGQREILIQRQARLRRWVNPAMWYALTCGVAAMLIAWAAAPIAASAYHDPKLLGLIVVYALYSPLGAVSVVLQALLECRFRFKTLSITSLISTSTLSACAVCLAAEHFGPYSVILASPVAGIVEVTLLLAIVRPRLLPHPQLRRWRFILPDGARLLGSRAFATLISQGDYTAMGWYFSKYAVGIYYFAFNLSVQTLGLFGQGVEGVLFPTFSKLSDDPKRQRQGFLTALHTLAAIAIPLILLQAALSESIVRALFATRWLDAVPVLEILGVGMALRVVASPAQSLLKARGHFGTIVKLSAVGAFVFLTLVFSAARSAGDQNAALRVATAAAIYYAMEGPVTLYLALRTVGGGARDVWGALAVPVLAGAISVTAGLMVANRLPAMQSREWIRMFVATGVAGAVYVGALILLFPSWWALLIGLIDRVRQVARRAN